MRHLMNTEEAAPIFGDWEETIIWSCLQGVMGDVYVMDEDGKAVSAAAWLGDFCLLGGLADGQLIRDIYEEMAGRGQTYLIMVPQDDSWAEQIEHVLGDHAKGYSRYAIKKERDVFDRKKLEQAVSTLNKEFTLKWIDRELYNACMKESWSKDLTAQYDTYEKFANLGLGVAALHNGEMVAGASSYSSYNGGIEIEIDTKKEYRRRGLAYACGAKLILECLDRGIYPSWDAQNRESVALAEKLGYHFDYEYLVYEVRGHA